MRKVQSRDRELGSAIRVVNLLGMRFDQTLLFMYGSDLPGEGGARTGTWSSSVLSVVSVVFAGSMFERCVAEKGDLSGCFGRIP